MGLFSGYNSNNGTFEQEDAFAVLPNDTVVTAYIEEAQVKNGTKADYLNFKWKFKFNGVDRIAFQSLFINGDSDFTKQQVKMFGAILENCGFTAEQLAGGSVPDPLTTTWLKENMELKKMDVKFGVKTVKKGYDKSSGTNYDLDPADYYKENFIKGIGKVGGEQKQEKINIGKVAQPQVPQGGANVDDDLPFASVDYRLG